MGDVTGRMNYHYVEVDDLPQTSIRAELKARGVRRVKCLGVGILGLDTYTFYQEEEDGSLFFIAVSEMKMTDDRRMFEGIAEKAGVDI